MPIRFTELEAYVTANLRDFERGMDRAEKSAQETAKTIERAFQTDFLKNPIANLRERLDAVKAEWQRLQQMRASMTSGRSGSGANFREAGQFLEELSRGDLGEGLVQLTASAGKAGVAVAGIGIAAVGAGAGIAALTRHVVQNVREVDQLAREHRLASIQIQSLQVLADLTGESVSDLAENYKKVAPEAKRMEQLVKSSGAAIDQDLRVKTQEAALAWQELRLSGEGALNAIARESLPAVTAVLKETALLIRDLKPAWQLAGEGAAAFANGARDEINDLRRLVALFKGELGSVNLDIAKKEAGRAPNVEAAREILRGTGGWFGIGQPSEQEINKLLAFGAPHKFTPRKGPSNRFSIPSLAKGAKGSGASDADAARRAEIELEKTQAAQLLAIEQKRLDQTLDLERRKQEERLRFIGDNAQGQITAINSYYTRRIQLQEQSIQLEIENEKSLWYRLNEEQQKARKQSEKVRLEAEKERVSGKLDLLRLEQSGLRGSEEEERAKRIKEVQEQQYKTARDLASAYKDLQGQLVSLNGSDYDVFLQNLQKTTAELQHLATITNNQNAFKLLSQYTQSARRQFALTHSQDVLGGRLDWERNRVLQRGELGLLTEGQTRKEILGIETRIGEQLRVNLRQQIAIAEAQGREVDALRLRQQLEDANLLGVDRERIQRLKDLKKQIGSSFEDARLAVVTGQESLLEAARGLALNISNTFFDELQTQMIRRITDNKYSSLGEMLGDAVGGLFGKLFNKVNPVKPGAGKDPVTEAITKQTESLTTILQEQIKQQAQAVARLTDLANCSCQPAPQEGFWKGLAKAAIGGAVAGLTGGLLGGAGGRGGETLTPSLANNPAYTSTVGAHGVPLYQKRAAGGGVSAYKPYIWNEPSAEGEWFVPTQNGYILNRNEARQALTDAARMRGGRSGGDYQPLSLPHHDTQWPDYAGDTKPDCTGCCQCCRESKTQGCLNLITLAGKSKPDNCCPVLSTGALFIGERKFYLPVRAAG